MNARLAWLSAAFGLAGVIQPSASAATFRIEIDYMVDSDHTHQPSDEVIDAVVQMFACQGHTLIIDVDDAITHYNVLRRNPNDCDGSLFNYSGMAASFGALKAMFFDHSHDDGWHYCIFAHQYEDDECDTSGSSGLGERPGWNFIVTLGGFSGETGTDFDQAATLAHEFGHNLGLTHCGTMNCGSDTGAANYVGPHVPNMPSIMSYRYQLTGVRTNMIANGMAPEDVALKDIDYSHGRLCSLNENSLNETLGTIMSSTDWNCNGSLQASVAQDINGNNGGWCGSNGNRTTLSDFNEWANIADPLPSLTAPEEVSCITAEEWEQVKRDLAFGAGTQPELAVEPCIGRNIFIGPSAIPSGICGLPFPGVQQAHNAAPQDSAFFFRPGVYNESGPVILNKRGVYMSNLGTAEIR